MRSRIRYKIIGPFLFLAFCTALAGSAIAFFMVANDWHERLVNQLAAVARIANDTMVEQEMTNLQFLRWVATAPAQREIGAPAVGAAVAAKDQVGLRRATDPFLNFAEFDVNLDLDRLIILDQTGYSLLDMERVSTEEQADSDYTEHPTLDFSQVWFVPRILSITDKSAEDAFSGLVALPDPAGDLSIYICTAVPIYAKGQSTVVGSVIMGIRLENLLNTLRQRSQAAIVTLYTTEGMLLASTALPEQTVPLTLDDLIVTLPMEAYSVPASEAGAALRMDIADLQQLQAYADTQTLDDKPVVTTININGRPYEVLYNYLVIHDTRVGIMATGLSSEYVVWGWNKTRLPIVSVTILVMFSIILIGMIVARQISHPLERLVAVAGAFVAGSRTSSEPGSLAAMHGRPLQDEIEILSASFKRMTRNQQALVRRVLREASQRAAIVESISEGIIVCDTTGTIRSINPSMRRLLGLSADAAAPEHFRDLPFTPVVEPVFGSQPSDLFMLHAAVVRVTCSPIIMSDDASRIGDVYLVQDMTAEVNIDRARTGFTATISHELRTPLTVVQGNTQLLLQGFLGPLDEMQKQVITTVQQHTTAMSRLLANAIQVAEIDAGAFRLEPEPLDLVPVVTEALHPLHTAITARGLSLILDIPDDFPQILADKFMAPTIIRQLVDNACTYTDTGSITLHAVQHDSYARIDVSDTGCGIAPPLLERVFDRFVRGEDDDSNERPDRGIGLGLTIVKLLVEQHGGRVWLTSEPGCGTTASFTLPLHTTSDSLSGNTEAESEAVEKTEVVLPPPDLPAPVPLPSSTEKTDKLVSVIAPDSVATASGLPAGTLPSQERDGTNSGQVARQNAAGLDPVHPLPTLPAITTFIIRLLWPDSAAIEPVWAALLAGGLQPESPQPASPEATVPNLNAIPVRLFQEVLLDILPRTHQRWMLRARTLPIALTWAQRHFTNVYSLDVVTLNDLLRQVGFECNRAEHTPMGCITALIDARSRLPLALWFEDEQKSGVSEPPALLLRQRVIGAIEPNTLLLCDFDLQTRALFEHCSAPNISILSMMPLEVEYATVRILQQTEQIDDRIVRLEGIDNFSKTSRRRIELVYQDTRYVYLTNILDPARMPVTHVRGLYAQHCRSSAAFTMVKQMLLSKHGLSPTMLWDSTPTIVQTQFWTTWALYALLVDLTDAVAEKLHQPGHILSPEMVYRKLHHLYTNYQMETVTDLVAYLAAQDTALDEASPDQQLPKQRFS